MLGSCPAAESWGSWRQLAWMTQSCKVLSQPCSGMGQRDQCPAGTSIAVFMAQFSARKRARIFVTAPAVGPLGPEPPHVPPLPQDRSTSRSGLQNPLLHTMGTVVGAEVQMPVPRHLLHVPLGPQPWEEYRGLWEPQPGLDYPDLGPKHIQRHQRHKRTNGSGGTVAITARPFKAFASQGAEAEPELSPGKERSKEGGDSQTDGPLEGCNHTPGTCSSCFSKPRPAS